MTHLVRHDEAERAPFIRSWWTADRVTLVQAVALVPPVVTAVALRGTPVLAVLSVAIAVALVSELLFSAARGRAHGWHGITGALIVSVMAPPDLPLWQPGIATAFGIIFGELVFGGRGFGFLNAGAAALAFLVFSFPGVVLLGGEAWIAAATLPGAALLLWHGLVAWQVLIAAIAGFAVAMLAGGAAIEPAAGSAALFFGLVFLIADPLAAAATPAGRWIYGVLAGGLIVLFASFEPVVAQAAMVFAALLASLFAPLIDQIVIRVMAQRISRGG